MEKLGTAAPIFFLYRYREYVQGAVVSMLRPKPLGEAGRRELTPRQDEI